MVSENRNPLAGNRIKLKYCEKCELELVVVKMLAENAVSHIGRTSAQHAPRTDEGSITAVIGSYRDFPKPLKVLGENPRINQSDCVRNLG